MPALDDTSGLPALHYSIDPERETALITGDGPMFMTTMIEAVEGVARDPAFRPRFTVIFDLRQARYTAMIADGDALADVLRKKGGDFRNRFAVVVPESLHILAKLYCLVVTMAGFDRIRCFTDMEEAERWCCAARKEIPQR
jgi:hypothetical protein